MTIFDVARCRKGDRSGEGAERIPAPFREGQSGEGFTHVGDEGVGEVAEVGAAVMVVLAEAAAALAQKDVEFLVIVGGGLPFRGFGRLLASGRSGDLRGVAVVAFGEVHENVVRAGVAVVAVVVGFELVSKVTIEVIGGVGGGSGHGDSLCESVVRKSCGGEGNDEKNYEYYETTRERVDIVEETDS